MGQFIVYNASGKILGAYIYFGFAASQVASLIAANTPAGCSALAVPEGSPCITQQTAYTVKGGAVASAAVA
jgi:hypothetical protein